MLVAGVAVGVGITMITPSATSSGERHGIDEFAPVFHFREQHSTVVSGASRPGVRGDPGGDR